MCSEKCKVYSVPGVRLVLYITVHGQCKVYGYGVPVGRLDLYVTVHYQCAVKKVRCTVYLGSG